VKSPSKPHKGSDIGTIDDAGKSFPDAGEVAYAVMSVTTPQSDGTVSGLLRFSRPRLNPSPETPAFTSHMGRIESVMMGMAILLLLLITIGYVAPPGASPLVLTSTISDSMTPGITQDEVLFIIT